MLFRSNKLMYDRQTFSLWGNLTGEPVVGKMATSGIRLKVLPMTLTSWGEWKQSNPETKVLHLNDAFGEQWNFRYLPGLADRARKGVSFPVWQKNKTFKEKDEIYALRINDQPKAYLIKTLIEKRVVNDRIGDIPIVLIVDSESEAVRAYKRSSKTFSLVAGKIQDEAGNIFQPLEEALVSRNEKLERIPGHVSWWFAWFGFFPHTEIYQ